MNDFALLTQQAISLLGPAISLAASTAAGHLADGFLSEPGAKLFNWIASSLKGTPAAITLDRAVAEPDNPRRLEALRLEIEDLVQSDSSFREQLVNLMNESSGATGSVTATQSSSQVGENNKSTQATGNDITINVR